MGCTLTNGMVPGQMGHGLGMAHHYRMPDMRNKAPLRAGGPLPSQVGLGKAQLRDLRPGETNGLLESIERLRRMLRDR